MAKIHVFEDLILTSQQRLDKYTELKQEIDNRFVFNALNPKSYFHASINTLFQKNLTQKMKQLSMRLDTVNKDSMKTLEALRQCLQKSQK